MDDCLLGGNQGTSESRRGTQVKEGMIVIWGVGVGGGGVFTVEVNAGFAT